MTMTEPGADLILRPHVAPMSPDEAKQAMSVYREMCRSLLDADDMQRVGDRDFTKRSGFQKLAAAYGVSTEIKSLDVEYDEDGHTKLARAIVHAVHPNGRYAEGDGACSSNEKRFRRGAEKIDHDLPATAVTRATNRAVSNLIAFGTVSAEEAEASETGASPRGDGRGTPPAWAAPMTDIPGVAHNLVRVLQAAGVDKAGEASVRIGEEIFQLCEDSFPFALARLAHLLANECEGLGQEKGGNAGEAEEPDVVNQEPSSIDAEALDAEADAAIDKDNNDGQES